MIPWCSDVDEVGTQAGHIGIDVTRLDCINGSHAPTIEQHLLEPQGVHGFGGLDILQGRRQLTIQQAVESTLVGDAQSLLSLGNGRYMFEFSSN